MGSAFSFLLPDGGACASAPASPGLGDLPESCVASVLVHLDPQQICQLAVLNRAFRGASSADFVWESKLPPNYSALIERVFEDKKFPVNLCKRDIYARLCVPNSFDGGTKVRSFALVYPMKFQTLYCLEKNYADYSFSNQNLKAYTTDNYLIRFDHCPISFLTKIISKGF